jgi:hypothetical protein
VLTPGGLELLGRLLPVINTNSWPFSAGRHYAVRW